MSDGPHKSLNMSRKWKRFAESAASDTYSYEDTESRLCEGVAEDWQVDVSPRLLRALQPLLEEAQPTLFGDHEIPDLTPLIRDDPECKVFARRVVEFAQHALQEGNIGPGALRAVVELALQDRVTSRMAQVEEHYLRSAEIGGAATIRAQNAKLLNSTALKDLAKKICDGGRISSIAPLTRKHEGVDDGVTLP